MELVNHIIMRDGKAWIAGKEHLKAEMVARMVVDGAYDIAAVMAQYQLTHAEVHSALAYYYDNREELDAAHQRQLDEIRAHASTFEQFKAQLLAKKS